MMRGAAAPERPMTYDSTKGNFLRFPDLGCEGPDLGSGVGGRIWDKEIDIRSGRPDLRLGGGLNEKLTASLT